MTRTVETLRSEAYESSRAPPASAQVEAASPESGPGGALDVHLEGGAVVGQPALGPGPGDQLVPAVLPVGGGRPRLRGGAQGRHVEERGLAVPEPAETGPLQHRCRLLVGHLTQRQMQPAKIVDVHAPRLGTLVGARHHLDDHGVSLLGGLRLWPRPGSGSLQGPDASLRVAGGRGSFYEGWGGRGPSSDMPG